MYIAAPKLPHGVSVILKKFLLCFNIFFSSRIEVLMVMVVSITDFWHMTQCSSLIEV